MREQVILMAVSHEHLKIEGEIDNEQSMKDHKPERLAIQLFGVFIDHFLISFLRSILKILFISNNEYSFFKQLIYD